MSSKIRCGTCTFYNEFPGLKEGACGWATVVPWCMQDQEWLVSCNDGKGCSCWEPRAERNNQADRSNDYGNDPRRQG